MSERNEQHLGLNQLKENGVRSEDTDDQVQQTNSDLVIVVHHPFRSSFVYRCTLFDITSIEWTDLLVLYIRHGACMCTCMYVCDSVSCSERTCVLL